MTEKKTSTEPARRGSYASHAEEFPEAHKRFVEASAELKAEFALTPKEAADATVRFHELKAVRAYVLATTGEVLDTDAYDSEHKYLHDMLAQYISDHGGEPVSVEGLPDLELKVPESLEVDPQALLDAYPDVFWQLMGARQVKIPVKDARKVLDPDQLTRFNELVRSVGMSPRLGFAKERGR